MISGEGGGAIIERGSDKNKSAETTNIHRSEWCSPPENGSLSLATVCSGYEDEGTAKNSRLPVRHRR